MKRPSRELKEVFIEKQERVRENSRFYYEQSDKLITWLIGFSVTGLTLMISKFTNFNTQYTVHLAKIILYLLSSTVTLGILYRLFFYFHQIQYRNFELYFETSLSTRETMNIEADELNENDGINEVVRRLKIDFWEDHNNTKDLYFQSNPDYQKILLKSLKDHHRNVAKWAKADYNLGLSFIKDVYKTGLGLSDKTINKLFDKEQSGTKIRQYGWISFICFVLCVILFLTTIFLLTINF